MGNKDKFLSEEEAYWDKWAKSFDDANWVNNYLRAAQSSLIPILDIREGMTFLDIGCGAGFALGRIAALINGKGQFYGIDLSQKMIDKATENFKGEDNFHFIKANAESIPLDTEAFDIIICNNSFHHYLHPVKALKEMWRLLKSDGRVYILDPTANYLFLRLVDRIIKLTEHEHVKMYSTKEFRSMFAEAGLKYIDTAVLNMDHGQASVLERIINRTNNNKVHIGGKGQ